MWFDTAQKSSKTNNPSTRSNAQNTIGKLQKVVLELAAERDISSASVSEIARRAGVTRVTVYQYAKSPIELLTSALNDELDAMADQRVAEIQANPSAVMAIRRAGLRTLVDHVRRHKAIYSGQQHSSYLVLGYALAKHIEKRALALLDAGVFAEMPGGLKTHRLYAAHFGHGVAAAMQAWLQSDDQDVELLLDILEDASGDWMRRLRSTD